MATVAAVKISVPGDSVDPTSAWDRRKVKQKVKTVKPQSHKEKKKEGHTRFVCISGSYTVPYVCGWYDALFFQIHTPKREVLTYQKGTF